MDKHLIAVLPGDGIGPEVIAQATRLLEHLPGLVPGLDLGQATTEAGGGDEVLEHAHRAEGLWHLVAATDPQAAALVRRQSGDVFSLEQHPALVHSNVAGDQVEQGGFARSIGPQDP